MRTTDPVVVFLLVVAIGIIAGFLFDQPRRAILACPAILRIDARHHHERAGGCCRCVCWLSPCAVACSPRRTGDDGHCGGGRCRCGPVRLADGQVTNTPLQQQATKPPHVRYRHLADRRTQPSNGCYRTRRVYCASIRRLSNNFEHHTWLGYSCRQDKGTQGAH